MACPSTFIVATCILYCCRSCQTPVHQLVSIAAAAPLTLTPCINWHHHHSHTAHTHVELSSCINWHHHHSHTAHTHTLNFPRASTGLDRCSPTTRTHDARPTICSDPVTQHCVCMGLRRLETRRRREATAAGRDSPYKSKLDSRDHWCCGRNTCCH